MVSLFGSFVYGKPNKNSDIDLCVVISNNHSFDKAYRNMAVTLFDNGFIPMDLLIYKEKYFKKYILAENSIENTIHTKGKIIYER
jgi:predicted nucleotidyltransferase